MSWQLALGGASIVQSILGSNAASDAAQAQASASTRAANLQLEGQREAIAAQTQAQERALAAQREAQDRAIAIQQGALPQFLDFQRQAMAAQEGARDQVMGFQQGAADRSITAQNDALAQFLALQRGASDQTMGLLRGQLDQVRADTQPYRQTGTEALDRMRSMMGESGMPTAEQVMADPGYQFGLTQGRNALEGSAAARGGLYSGNALKELTAFGTDYGTTRFNDAFQRQQQDVTSRWSRLAGLAGLGQNATVQAQNAGQQFAGTAGNLLTGGADAQGGAIMGNANAMGSIFGNTANAQSNAVSGAANNIGNIFGQMGGGYMDNANAISNTLSGNANNVGSILTGGANQLSNIYTNTANNLGSIWTNNANAQGAAGMARANIWGNGINQLAGLAMSGRGGQSGSWNGTDFSGP